ncbi:MAG: glycosyltransferase family 2 protein [Lachnospiraceae bacterium]|nr:glycosyltransferase family 2 protein [Lachnospiraceae bacterium]
MTDMTSGTPAFTPGLVSIITPAYNAAAFLEETVRSAQAQTYTNWEMIIVDDCSTDSTVELVKRLQKDDPRIRLIRRKQNGGPARAWNTAFRVMRGQYAAFLDSDDLWTPEKLAHQLAFMESHHYGFTYGSYDWIDEHSEALDKTIRIPDHQNYRDMLMNSVIGALTVVIDRSIYEIPQIPPAQINDSMLWLTLAKSGAEAYGLQEIIGHYRIASNSFSRNKGNAAKGLWVLYRDYLKLPLPKRVWYFSGYAVNALKRYAPFS